MPRVLVIDDDRLGRTVLKSILEKAGHEVVEAVNGKEGAELFQSNPTDLIITDIFMPEQDGIATILKLTREFPDVKIIAVSGGGNILQSGDYLQHAKDFGAFKTFKKPVDPDELIQAVNELLG